MYPGEPTRVYVLEGTMLTRVFASTTQRHPEFMELEYRFVSTIHAFRWLELRSNSASQRLCFGGCNERHQTLVTRDLFVFVRGRKSPVGR